MSFLSQKMIKKAALFTFVLAGLSASQSALALKCIGYVSVNGGEFMCAGWRTESACEENPRLCMPTPPPTTTRPPSSGSNSGIPGGGPFSGNRGSGDPPTPEEMTCSQLHGELAKQQQRIKQLSRGIQFVNDELDTARRNLDGPLSQGIIDQVKSEAEAKCNTWSDMVVDNPIRVCSERNGHEICRNRQLTSSERTAFNSCNATMARYTSLVQSRSKVIDLEAKDMAQKNSLIASRDAVTEYLKQLDDAKDSKNCGRQ